MSQLDWIPRFDDILKSKSEEIVRQTSWNNYLSYSYAILDNSWAFNRTINWQAPGWDESEQKG